LLAEQLEQVLISCTIEQKGLQRQGDTDSNLCRLALGYCMETLHEFLHEKGQHQKSSHIVAECLGDKEDKEDKELELEFRRVCAGNNRLGTALSFEVLFADKMVCHQVCNWRIWWPAPWV
jgi:hypothetical protein